MPKLDGKVTHYMVTWTYPNRKAVNTPVSLTEGYTNFSSIPGIIAIKRNLDGMKIEILAIVKISETSTDYAEKRLAELVGEYLELTLPKESDQEMTPDQLKELIYKTRAKALQVVEMLLNTRYLPLINAEK